MPYYIPSNISILNDNPSNQNKQSFEVIDNLFDTVFEKLDEAIDMKKGLLADTEDVAVGSSLHGIEGKEAEDGGARHCGNRECAEVQVFHEEAAALLPRQGGQYGSPVPTPPQDEAPCAGRVEPQWCSLEYMIRYRNERGRPVRESLHLRDFE